MLAQPSQLAACAAVSSPGFVLDDRRRRCTRPPPGRKTQLVLVRWPRRAWAGGSSSVPLTAGIAESRPARSWATRGGLTIGRDVRRLQAVFEWRIRPPHAATAAELMFDAVTHAFWPTSTSRLDADRRSPRCHSCAGFAPCVRRRGEHHASACRSLHRCSKSAVAALRLRAPSRTQAGLPVQQRSGRVHHQGLSKGSCFRPMVTDPGRCS